MFVASELGDHAGRNSGRWGILRATISVNMLPQVWIVDREEARLTTIALVTTFNMYR